MEEPQLSMRRPRPFSSGSFVLGSEQERQSRWTRMGRVSRWAIDYAGVLYALSLALSLYALFHFEVCITIMSREQCDTREWVAVFLLFQVLANLFCFHFFATRNDVFFWLRDARLSTWRVGRQDAASDVNEDDEGPLLPTVVDDTPSQYWQSEGGGKYCNYCERPAPLRSHHCVLCNMCVLRKDHHCFLTGRCVGIGNQRYFIVFLFWVAIACAYCMVLGVDYLSLIVSPPLPWGWTSWIAPVAMVRWCLGLCTLWQAFAALMFSLVVGSFFGAFAFFVMQVFYTLHGYTMYEYHVAITRDYFEGDGATVAERLRLVFGPKWPLHFLVPFVWGENRLTTRIAQNLFEMYNKHI